MNEVHYHPTRFKTRYCKSFQCNQRCDFAAGATRCFRAHNDQEKLTRLEAEAWHERTKKTLHRKRGFMSYESVLKLVDQDDGEPPPPQAPPRAQSEQDIMQPAQYSDCSVVEIASLEDSIKHLEDMLESRRQDYLLSGGQIEKQHVQLDELEHKEQREADKWMHEEAMKRIKFEKSNLQYEADLHAPVVLCRRKCGLPMDCVAVPCGHGLCSDCSFAVSQTGTCMVGGCFRAVELQKIVESQVREEPF